MFEPKIKVRRSLYRRLEEAARAKGYASTQEFAEHVLEQAAGDDAGTQTEEEVRKRLQGLGYLG